MKVLNQKGSKAYLSLLNKKGVGLVASGIIAAWKKFQECSTKNGSKKFRILDIGCGDGSYWRLVQDQLGVPCKSLPSHDLVLVDLSESCFDECRKNQLPNSDFLCLKFPFSNAISAISEKKFDLVVFSAVFHELRLQAASDRICSEKNGPLFLSDIVESLFANLLDKNLLSESACILVADLVHQPYWHLDALNLARDWQANDLPKHLGVTTGGHADPSFAFLDPREIVLGATTSNEFYLEDHQECQSLPDEFRDMPIECYSSNPMAVRSVVRSREFYLLTFRRSPARKFHASIKVFAQKAGNFLSLQEDLGGALRSLRKALKSWDKTRAKNIEKVFRENIGGPQSKDLTCGLSNKALFLVTVDRVSQIIQELCLQCGIMPPRRMSFWPSVKSKLLKELGRPYRFLTTSVFDEDYDGTPFVVSDSGISIERDWVSICYDSLFLRQKFTFPDEWIGKNIRFPSLFTAMMQESDGHLHESTPRSLALVVQPLDRLMDADFCERLREYNLANNTSKPSQGHWVLILEPPCQKTSPLSNSRKVDMFFGNQLSGDEPLLRSVHLSILELYLDFLFAAAGQKTSPEFLGTLRALELRWKSVQFFSSKAELESLSGRYETILPSQFRDTIGNVVTTLRTHVTSIKDRLPISAWHLIPGSSFLDPDDVTGNLMILTDKVIPAPVSDKIRVLHDEMLNLFQRVDDEAVLVRTNYLQREHAIKSARAAIMSRNLSHNVGSHTLANSRFFEAIGVFNALSKNLYNDEYFYVNGEHLKTRPVRNARDRFSRFLGYLQGRLDFIARALGEGNSMADPMFFVGDMLQGFLAGEVLLNTLLSDNGITIEQMEFRIRLPGMNEDAVYKGANQEDQELRHFSFLLANDSSPVRDLLIAVPGGMVGRHAFYAFIENVMRNAAKYGEGTEEKMVIRIEVNAGKALNRMTGNTEQCYFLEITDNRSIDESGTIAKKVRKYLNDSIITADGSPQKEGHGIQEMKVCAEFLGGEELVFPSDDMFKENRELGLDSLKRYIDYLTVEGREKFLNEPSKLSEPNRISWIKHTNNALLAWTQSVTPELVALDDSTAEKPRQQNLIYKLILTKPVIFGIVDKWGRHENSYEAESTRVANNEDAIVFYRDIETLANNPAHFGLVLVVSLDSLSSILADVAKFHYSLPSRLLLVFPDRDLAAKAQATINRFSHGLAGGKERLPIPARRLFAISCPDLFEGKKCAKRPEDIPPFSPHDRNQKGDRGDNNGLRLFKTIAEGWLIAWKGHELPRTNPEGSGRLDQSEGRKLNRWHLCIGFDREGEGNAAIQRWRNLDKIFDSEIVKVWVAISEKHFVTSDSAQDDTISKSQVIIYDNHGKGQAFGWFKNNQGDNLGAKPVSGIKGAQACYHSFSGSSQIDLCHSLETPPEDPFGMAFLIYSLLESSLLSVAVLDERVAEAMIEGENKLFQKEHLELVLARIYPLFQVRRINLGEPDRNCDELHMKEAAGNAEKEKKAEPLYLSPGVKKAVNTTVLSASNPEIKGADEFGYLKDESYCLDESEGLTIKGPPSGQEIATVMPWVRAMQPQRLSRTLIAPLNNPLIARSGDLDMIVIHEGVIDMLAKREWWKEDTVEALFSAVPIVVRTSGRGSNSRHDGDHLPFLEFSELSGSTYQSLNKFSLGRALLGLRGQTKKR